MTKLSCPGAEGRPHSSALLTTDTPVPSKLGWQPAWRARRGEAEVRPRKEIARATNLKVDDIIEKLKLKSKKIIMS
jgi:hypothetical protein